MSLNLLSNSMGVAELDCVSSHCQTHRCGVSPMVFVAEWPRYVQSYVVSLTQRILLLLLYSFFFWHADTTTMAATMRLRLILPVQWNVAAAALHFFGKRQPFVYFSREKHILRGTQLWSFVKSFLDSQFMFSTYNAIGRVFHSVWGLTI